MTTLDVFIKAGLRLNKSDTNDYDNLWTDVVQEAWNKAKIEWVRRQIRGKNQTQEGDEESKDRVDDLQVLLKNKQISASSYKVYSESSIPDDYFYYKRVSPLCSKDECLNKILKSTLEEEANVDVLLNDKTPSWKFEETFNTLIGNKIRVYHNSEFICKEIKLTYYRKPKYDKIDRVAENIIEFKDDVCEMIIDEMVKILASDIESINQKNLSQERVENNN